MATTIAGWGDQGDTRTMLPYRQSSWPLSRQRPWQFTLEGYRRHAKDEAALDRLIGYLHARAEWLPNYRQRRRDQQYIGSGQVEKANDLLVARRQKQRGMQWSEATSDGLAALRTLMLNGGWDRYWVDGEVLPLAEAA